MRSLSITVAVLLALTNASCGGGSGPTERDIVNNLEDELRSVAGQWTGVTNIANGVSLDFTLQEGSNGQLTGSGTMKETNAAAAVPITITGTFQRPQLTLVFAGMVYESKPVQGNAQGSYTTVGGIGTNLVLTAPGYSREIPVLLQEK